MDVNDPSTVLRTNDKFCHRSVNPTHLKLFSCQKLQPYVRSIDSVQTQTRPGKSHNQIMRKESGTQTDKHTHTHTRTHTHIHTHTRTRTHARTHTHTHTDHTHTNARKHIATLQIVTFYS